MDEKEKEKERRLRDAALSGAAAEKVQRYGSAVKVFEVAYSGNDRETNTQLSKGLKQISESKVNPETQSQNIKQQAGFAAEVRTQARENAEKTISGDNSSRTTRTDDMRRQPDGKGSTIGGTNDQHYDIAEVDANGIYIQGSGRQLKYVGGNADECYQRLMGKKFDKYRDADVPMEVPSDFYNRVQEKLSERAASLEKQIAKAESSGNTELANKHREQLERVEKTKKNLRKGKLTNKEAIEARKHPELATGKDIGMTAHRAGMEAAKTGAAISGAVALVQNVIAVAKHEKGMDEAALDVVKDTASGAALSYGTAAVGAVIKGTMQNAGSELIRDLSKTNLPGTVVTVALNASKTMAKYFNGKIDGVECLEELGEQGTGMVSSAMFATIGQIAIPIPVVGGLIGGMVGYAVSSACYGVLTDSLKEAKLAHEERLRVEQECEQMIQIIRECRLELERLTAEYLLSYTSQFQSAFDSIKTALAIGDVDGFIQGANSISETMGRSVQFNSMSEFDAIMASDIAFKL